MNKHFFETKYFLKSKVWGVIIVHCCFQYIFHISSALNTCLILPIALTLSRLVARVAVDSLKANEKFLRNVFRHLMSYCLRPENNNKQALERNS